MTCLGVHALESNRHGFKSQHFQLTAIGKVPMLLKTQVPQWKNDIAALTW